MWSVTGIAVARHEERWTIVATAREADDHDSVWYLDPGATAWSMLDNIHLPLGGSSRPAVAANADGRFEVVAVGSDGLTGTVWNARQLSPGGDWSNWTSLQTPPGQETVDGRPALARNKNGRLELFVLDRDGKIWHRWQKQAGGDAWEGWRTLGSPGEAAVNHPPTVVQNPDGHLELFVTDFDEVVAHRWQDPTAPGGWSGWHSLGSPSAEVTATGPPALATNVDGRLDLFVTARDGAVWHRRQDPSAPGGWSGWKSLERQGLGFVELAAAAVPDGPLVLFALADFDTPNDLWMRKQPAPGAEWQPWRQLADLFKEEPSDPGRIMDPTVAVLPDSDAEAVQLFLRDGASVQLHRLLVFAPPGPPLAAAFMQLQPPPDATFDP